MAYASFTTQLPDAQQPTLGNGVEDEVAVSTPDVLNNGDYRIQIRETGQSSWDSNAVGYDEQVISADDAPSGTIETIFTGREDGEEYEVRIRSETEHRTGAWTEPVSIVTQFPGAANPTIGSVAATSVQVDAQDNADNETGFRLERDEQLNGEWQDRRVVTERGPHAGEGAITITDDTASPGRTYRYRVEAYTEHTAATSNWTSSVSTPGLDDPHPESTQSVPPRGWHIELDHPETGRTRTLRLADTPTPKPRLNARPELDIPVPADNHWVESEAWEDATVRAYHHGVRVPIESVAKISPEPDHVTLTTRGGSRLQERANHDFSDVRVETAIETILTQDTDYTVEVDAAPATANQPWRTLDTVEDFDVVPRSGGPHEATGSGSIVPRQTAWILPPQAFSTSKLVGETTQNWTSSEAIELALNTSTAASIELPYRIPEGEVGVAVRLALDGVGFAQLHVDGGMFGATPTIAGNTDAGAATRTVSWAVAGETDNLGGLTAGSHTVSLSYVDGGYRDADGSGIIDCAVVYDKRYWNASDFSNTLDANNKLDGPPGLYAPIGVDFEVDPLRRATGGRLEAVVSSTSNGQGLGLSMNGDTWTTQAGTATLEADFESSTGSFLARATLSGVDASSPETDVETSVTTYRTRPQTLDALTVEYDAISSPGVSETVDATVADAISSLCDRGNLIWELQYAESEGLKVVVTRPGQRPTHDLNEDLVDWSVEKDVEASPTAAVVHGRNYTVEGEEFTADINNVELLHDPIVVGSTTVTDSEGVEYERGTDYVVNHVLGEIKMPDLGSALTQGETYQISYERQTVGEYYAVGDAGRPAIRDLPQVISESQAEQAALYIVDESEGPVISASASLAGSRIGYQLTRALDLDGLPDVGSLRIESVTGEGGQVQLELGLGRTVADVVGELQGTLTDTARQT
ncbi:hypothetical protein [Halobacterium sp. CBA1126]|uniref:hypothetical protein n=1 Tax=Halobacterium sp. CBA1126 TaxID=2668074 RepID=UPI0012F9C8ED|nr:hypothetical protein [Halobacterium sp. CBA1126]MUV59969.1 hypothetical protein [Halobacterium sp. CBA1126]